MPVALVPAYIWPTDDAAWARVTAGTPGLIIVTGDNSGPGTTRSAELQARITWLIQRHWTPIAYVRLDYLRRPLGDVAGDVARWRSWYSGLRGVFFDECPASGAPFIGAIPMLACAANGGYCAFNVGAQVGDDIWRATWPSRSIVVTFEGDAAAYAQACPPAHPRGAHLVYGAPTVPDWPRGLGWAWSTPDGADGNPWDGSTV